MQMSDPSQTFWMKIFLIIHYFLKVITGLMLECLRFLIVRNDTTNTFIYKSDLEKDHKITISDIIYNQIVSALVFQIKKFLKVKKMIVLFSSV